MSRPSPELPRIGVVLAAGQGTRMGACVPKVLMPVAGRPALAWVLDAARQAGCERIYVIVGHGADEVRAAFDRPDLIWVEQHEQLGTGHAVAQVERALGDEPALGLVLSGDGPMITAASLARLLEAAEAGWGALSVARLDEPRSLGRVVTDEHGGLERIVEVADATPADLRIQDVNAGHYAVRFPELFDHLREIDRGNAQGELYLTDAVVLAARQRPVECVRLTHSIEALGINDRRDLTVAHRALVDRLIAQLPDAGVTVIDPNRLEMEAGVEVGADTVIHADVYLGAGTRIGRSCVLHQGAWLRDTVLADGVEILPYSVLDGAKVAEGCRVGPFARLRPEAVLERGAAVGNFVEVKKSRLGAGVKAGHLAYLGDADIGDRTNIGAGVVTCNYDGRAKHRTTIGQDAFIGSDTMLVAPVDVGERALTGAGSVITKDVPADSLAVGRARQRNLAGWTRRQQEQNEPES